MIDPETVRIDSSKADIRKGCSKGYQLLDKAYLSPGLLLLEWFLQ